jgi:NADH-quinone oxidoreductase subunit N
MSPDVTAIDLFALAPELTLLATALLVLLVELFLPWRHKQYVNPIAAVGVLASGAWVAALALDGTRRTSFGNMFVVDPYALLFKAFFLATAFFVLFLSYRYFQEIRTYQGEYYFLLLAAFTGMLLMPSSRDLVMIFLALELVSVPGFVMAGLRKFDLRSNEGALKFFLIGVLSAAVLLFGLSVVYGFAGTTDLAGVGVALAQVEREPLLLASVLFVIVGFGFKISAVPFHFWAPDTYEGSPVPVTAFLSVASKAAGFAGLLQICFVAFLPIADVYAPVLGVVAVLTMTLGNLTALQQTNIVRLLAYSSVAHAGYMLVPFALVVPGDDALNSQAFTAVLVYLLAYAAMNIGAFAVVTAVARQQPDRLLTGYAGLGQRAPGMSIGFTLFLLSLGGVLPVVVGFWAKLYILQATIIEPSAGTLALAAAVVINSVIGAFYYLRLLRTTWFEQPVTEEAVRPGPALGLAIAALSAVVLVVGVYPQAFAGFAELSTLVGAVP